MTVVLPPDLERMVSEQLANGSYQSASDVLLDALKALREQRERDRETDEEVFAALEELS